MGLRTPKSRLGLQMGLRTPKSRLGLQIEYGVVSWRVALCSILSSAVDSRTFCYRREVEAEALAAARIRLGQYPQRRQPLHA